MICGDFSRKLKAYERFQATMLELIATRLVTMAAMDTVEAAVDRTREEIAIQVTLTPIRTLALAMEEPRRLLMEVRDLRILDKRRI